MTNSSPPPHTGLSLDGIEVVELSEVDLDFAVEEVFGKRAARPPALDLAATRTEPATADELRLLELCRGLSGDELAALAPRCQSIHAIPGYVLVSPGRLNGKVFFVLEGQLRLYSQANDKRPMAIADVGHSTGLRPALVNQPVNYAVIATEVSHIVAIDLATLDECAKRSHAFARNYAALLASYIRGDNCLHLSGRPPGSQAPQGYVDELTLLHNPHWLSTMFPRLVARARLGNKPLAVTAFAVDKLEEIIKAHGIGAGLRVLQVIGHWLLDQTRPTDILAINPNRHILAFLPDGDLNTARALAVRLRTAVQTLSISLAPEKTTPPIQVSLSIGIAELEHGMKETELLNKTEALIQKSVKLGGNSISESL